MDVWFGRAEVRPTEANTDEQFAGTAGAIVYVFAPALDFSEFESTVAAAFAEQDLDLEDYPDVCYVGAVERVEEDSVLLRHVCTAARWEDVEGFHLADITRVDFGNRYEEALALVAGAAPRP